MLQAIVLVRVCWNFTLLSSKDIPCESLEAQSQLTSIRSRALWGTNHRKYAKSSSEFHFRMCRKAFGYPVRWTGKSWHLALPRSRPYLTLPILQLQSKFPVGRIRAPSALHKCTNPDHEAPSSVVFSLAQFYIRGYSARGCPVLQHNLNPISTTSYEISRIIHASQRSSQRPELTGVLVLRIYALRILHRGRSYPDRVMITIITCPFIGYRAPCQFTEKDQLVSTEVACLHGVQI